MNAQREEMDLLCSESTETISPTHPQGKGQWQLEDCCSLELRVMSTDDARMELEWLLSSEQPANPLKAYCLPSNSERQRIVDTLCLVAETMHTSFATKSLAVSLLDRFLVTTPALERFMVPLAAVGCISIAAKFEEVDFPIQLFRDELRLLWDLHKRPTDLPMMELGIMSALRWRVQAVTPAKVLEPLTCLLDSPGMMLVEDCQQILEVRETCKIILARALRDAFFLHYRPSSIAMAAVLVAVNELFDVQTDFPSFDDALDDLYSPSHIAEVDACMQRIEETNACDGFPRLRSCRVDISGEDGVARVYQQKHPSRVTTTPSSVLQTAQAMTSDPPAREWGPEDTAMGDGV